jgi:hypothetical protein
MAKAVAVDTSRHRPPIGRRSPRALTAERLPAGGDVPGASDRDCAATGGHMPSFPPARDRNATVCGRYCKAHGTIIVRTSNAAPVALIGFGEAGIEPKYVGVHAGWTTGVNHRLPTLAPNNIELRFAI